MTKIGEKPEPSFGLDMSFDEALRRFAATKLAEVEKSIEVSKQKRPVVDEVLASEVANIVANEKPPRDEAPRRPARSKHEESSSGRKRRKPSDD